MTKGLQKNFALQIHGLILIFLLGEGLKIGFENAGRYQDKKTRITQSVRVTSCQSPIRMFQDDFRMKKQKVSGFV